MSSNVLRLLLLADTHLGFDLPFRPRIERRRRGHDFYANFRQALQRARSGDVDLVVHGGDLFYRSRVPPALVEMAMTPLVEVADTGIPVYIVPGNHERSNIPLHLWTAHPNIHIFDRPKTILYSGPKGAIALLGFPCVRTVESLFPSLVAQCGCPEGPDIPRLLCMHQTVEGAQVGPGNFTFRSGADVVRGRDIPPGLCAVLCGHIHRAQILTHDLNERPLAAPVVYPGSVERTSFAERDENKGYAVLTLEPTEGKIARVGVSFVPLPARPMVPLTFAPTAPDGETLTRQLSSRLRSLDPDSVVRIQVCGPFKKEALAILGADYLRALAPASMNIDLAPDRPQG